MPITDRLTRRGFLERAGRSLTALTSIPVSAPFALGAAQVQPPGLGDVPRMDGSFVIDDVARRAASTDLGRVLTRRPRAVLRPGSIADIVRIVEYANQKHSPVVMRGRGHSRYGLALVEDGIVIDSRSLNKVVTVTNETIDVEAGCLVRIGPWRGRCGIPAAGDDRLHDAFSWRIRVGRRPVVRQPHVWGVRGYGSSAH